jgi:hypothetical protein
MIRVAESGDDSKPVPKAPDVSCSSMIWRRREAHHVIIVDIVIALEFNAVSKGWRFSSGFRGPSQRFYRNI